MPPPPPDLPEDVLGDILLRLPPDDPACFLRAALVCKRWRRVLADPAFRRRHCALQRTPSIFGYLRIVDRKLPFSSRFVPDGPASRRPAGHELPGWLALDCRHGRALFVTQAPGPPDGRILDFIVWDPLTNAQRRLPQPSPPPVDGELFTAAVLCAAATRGCDHRGCHGGPFHVVFVSSILTLPSVFVTSARLYSSETGVWSELNSVQHPDAHVNCLRWSTVFVGGTLYFYADDCYAIGYQPDGQRLSVIEKPPQSMYNGHRWFLRLVDDGGSLGFVGVEEEPSFCLRLLSREISHDGIARWAQGRTIRLEPLLPDGTLLPPTNLYGVPGVRVIGVAERTDAVFVYIDTNEIGDVYMIHLNSGRAKKVGPFRGLELPYVSFCIPVMDAASSGERPRTSVLGGS